MKLLPCLALAAAASLHAQSVQTKIVFSKAQFAVNDGVNMTFEARNTGSSNVSYCTWNTPLGTIGGDVLNVSTVAGKARYVGALVKRGPLTEADYIILAPGQGITKTIDLSKYYDLSTPGTYTAKFSPKASLGPSPKTLQAVDIGKESAPATFSAPKGVAPAVTLPAPSPVSAKTANVPVCSNCTAAQTTALQAAYAAALSMSADAADSLRDTPFPNRATAVRSKTYFGAYDFGRYRSVANVLENINRSLRDENVTFTDISGNTSDPNHTAYAYVYPSQPYKVYLGTAFWSAATTGEDSKAGTMVHELSHFTIIGGTSDHVYGRSGCMNLATSNPANASTNADCFEYFSENPTTLAQSTDRKVRADFTDDGKADLGYFDPTTNSFYVTASIGAFFVFNGQWTAPNSFGWNKDQFYPGDFNGDGLADLGYFETGNNTFHVSINNGKTFNGPGSGAWTVSNSIGSTAGRILIGDFNGDRRTDIASFDPSRTQVAVSTSTGAAFNGLRSGVWVGTNQFGWQGANYFVGDFNGDRIADLGYAENDNTFHVNLSVGTGFFGAGSGRWVTASQFGGTWGKYYVGDFNGDGNSDLGFFEPGNNKFSVATSTKTGFFGPGTGAWTASGAIGTDKTKFLVGDFDGDGVDDLAYQETSNNSLKVSLSQKTAFSPAETWVNPNAFGNTSGKYFIGQSN